MMQARIYYAHCIELNFQPQVDQAHITLLMFLLLELQDMVITLTQASQIQL